MRKFWRFLSGIGWYCAGGFLPFLPVRFGSGKFAFLVHPRSLDDFLRPYPMLKKVPEGTIERFALSAWPYRVSRITGLRREKDGLPVVGYIIGIPMMARQMLERREAAAKKVARAVRLAERLGCDMVGLGMFTSVVTAGGEDLVGKSRCRLTSGNTVTAALALELADMMLEKKKRQKKSDCVAAVVGATGSIGTAVSTLLARDAYKKIICIARNKERLDALRTAIGSGKDAARIEATDDIGAIKEADLVIVVTSASDALIRPENVKKDAIIIDMTQPRNTSPELLARTDVTVIDGGIVETPGVNTHFPLGIPKGTAYACLAETMLRAAGGMEKDCVGTVSPADVPLLRQQLRALGFRLAPLTSFGKPVTL